MRKCLLFDCDGVIANTRLANYFSYLEAIESILGKSLTNEFTFKFYNRVYGKSWNQWLPELAADRSAEVHRLKIINYGECVSKYAEVLEGLRAIEFWHKKKFPIAIVSNSSKSSIKYLFDWICEKHDADWLINIPVFTPSSEIRAKPHPHLIHAAFSKLNVETGVLIDDNLQLGKLTAANAGIQFIHYLDDLNELNKLISQNLL